MDPLTLPVEDWDSLLSLAFGAAVVQIGYTDGSDTVTLARTASMIVAIGPDHRASGTPAAQSTDVWNAAVTAAGIRGRVIGSFMPFMMVLPLWQPDAFGLAVINPAAVLPRDLPMALCLAVCCARRIVVIDPDRAVDIDELIEHATPNVSTATIRSGSLWVINTVTTGHAVVGVA
jgi:hypothetical protein